MTRPRSQQINDPSTRYTKLPLKDLPSPGDLYTTISGGDYISLLNGTATQVVGGSEEDCPAVITATVTDPYSLNPSTELYISVDGNPAITVTLTPTETTNINGSDVFTGYRVAKKINAVLGIDIASRTDDGFLRLTSPTTGDSSSISISALLANTLKILFGVNQTPIIAYGQNKTRGVVTKSPDQLGGYMFPAYEDGRKLIANSNTLYNLGDGQNGIWYTQKIPTGQPVFGRLTSLITPDRFLINWYAKCTGSDDIISGAKGGDSDFTLLNGKSLSITFLDPSSVAISILSVTFSNPIVGPISIANQINTAWNSSTGALYGSVVTTVSEPYYTGSLHLDLKINGVDKTVTFTGDERSAADIAAAIDAVINVSDGSASDVGGSVRISSTLAGGGESSTIEILNSSDADLLRALGLGVGVYAGWKLCEVIGAEIKIALPSPTTLAIISAASTSLTNLGLTGYTTTDPVEVVEKVVKCGFPHRPAFSPSFSLLPEENAISLLIPEYMEAGDIQDNNFTQDKIDNNTSLNSDRASNNTFTTNADRHLGQARYGVDGNLQPETVPYNIRSARIGKVTFSNYGVDGPLESVIYSTGFSNHIFEALNFSNPSIRTYVYDDIADTPGYVITSNAKRQNASPAYIPDIAGEASSILDLNESQLTLSLRDAAGANPYSQEEDLKFYPSTLGSIDRELKFAKSTIINFSSGSANFADSYTVGNTTLGYYPLTGTNGAAYLRVHNYKREGNATSIFQHLNSRHEIVCGDGVNTFGDFNGVTALDDVISFLTTAGDSRPIRIHLKAGTYTSVSTLSFSGRDVEIIGDSQESSIINNPSGGNQNTLSFSGAGNTVKLVNLNIVAEPSYFSVKNDGPSLVIDSCQINDVHILTGSSSLYGNHIHVVNTLISGSATCIKLVYKSSVSTGVKPIVFERCSIDASSYGSPVRVMTIHGIAGASKFNDIAFNDCWFNLAEYTPVAPGVGETLPHMSENTGLVELYPLNNGRGGVGLVVENLTYNRCSIKSVSGNGYSCIIQICSNTTDQKYTNYLGHWGQINNLTFRDSTIEATLTPDAEANSMAYFVVGHGVESLTLDNCDIYPKTVSNTGRYGLLPEWFRWSNKSLQSTLDVYTTGIGLACKHATIRNSRVHDIQKNVGKAATLGFDIYLITGTTVNVDGLIVNGISSGTGDGIQRFSFISCNSESDCTDIIPSDYENAQTNLSKIKLDGANNSTGDWALYYMTVGTSKSHNYHIDNCMIQGFTSSSPSSDIIGMLLVNGTNIKLTNNEIKDVSFGITMNGDLDLVNVSNNNIIVGGYRGSGHDSCGIRFDNTGYVATSLIIDGNYVDDSISGDATYAAIDLLIDEGEGSILWYFDSTSPALKLTNNYVNWSTGKTSYFLRPASSTHVDRDPKGFIKGNSGSTYHNPVGFITSYPNFKLQRWDIGSTSYQAINNDEINYGKLFGAETSTNAVESVTQSNVNLTNGDTTWRFVGVPLTITNNFSGDITISYDAQFSLTNNNANFKSISCKLAYKVNSGSWTYFKTCTTIIPSVSGGAYSFHINLNGSLNVDDGDTVEIDLAYEADNDVVSIETSLSINVLTKKPKYTSGCMMINNSCKFITS